MGSQTSLHHGQRLIPLRRPKPHPSRAPRGPPDGPQRLASHVHSYLRALRYRLPRFQTSRVLSVCTSSREERRHLVESARDLRKLFGCDHLSRRVQNVLCEHLPQEKRSSTVAYCTSCFVCISARQNPPSLDTQRSTPCLGIPAGEQCSCRRLACHLRCRGSGQQHAACRATWRWCHAACMHGQ